MKVRFQLQWRHLELCNAICTCRLPAAAGLAAVMFVTAQIQQQPRTAQHQPLIITHTAFVTFNKSASRSTLYMWRVTHLLSILFISRTSSHQLCRSLFRIVRGAWLGQKWSELMFLSLWPFFSVVVTDPHLLHHFYLLSAQLPDRGHTFTSPKCGSLQKKYIEDFPHRHWSWILSLLRI